MRTLLGVLASLLVNGAVLGSIDWTAHQVPPAGEVTIVQLPDSPELATYAQVAPAASSTGAL
jgi:hypothetical protein